MTTKTNRESLDRWQAIYDRATFGRLERLDEIWQNAIDECERTHEDGDYTDNDVAEVALKELS